MGGVRPVRRLSAAIEQRIHGELACIRNQPLKLRLLRRTARLAHPLVRQPRPRARPCRRRR